MPEVLQVQENQSLTPDEVCEFCQHTQKTVYGHFGGHIPSKRVLHKQLKHECRRLPKYKRRCLMLIEPNIEIIFAEMTNTSFKSSKLCEQLKECGKNQSPIVTTFDADDGTFNETFQGTEIDARVLSVDLITPLPQT